MYFLLLKFILGPYTFFAFLFSVPKIVPVFNFLTLCLFRFFFLFFFNCGKRSALASLPCMKSCVDRSMYNVEHHTICWSLTMMKEGESLKERVAWCVCDAMSMQRC